MISHDPAQAQPEPWRQRFEALVAARMRTPFVWGAHDCCLWAADAVQAVAGIDHAATLRGTYKTALEAAKVLQAVGGLPQVAARAGEPIAPWLAVVGDVGLLEVEGRECLGVCVGHAWLVVAAQGLAAMPLGGAKQAWRVPHA